MLTATYWSCDVMTYLVDAPRWLLNPFQHPARLEENSQANIPTRGLRKVDFSSCIQEMVGQNQIDKRERERETLQSGQEVFPGDVTRENAGIPLVCPGCLKGLAWTLGTEFLTISRWLCHGHN